MTANLETLDRLGPCASAFDGHALTATPEGEIECFWVTTSGVSWDRKLPGSALRFSLRRGGTVFPIKRGSSPFRPPPGTEVLASVPCPDAPDAIKGDTVYSGPVVVAMCKR